jgi:hypothetical protein
MDVIDVSASPSFLCRHVKPLTRLPDEKVPLICVPYSKGRDWRRVPIPKRELKC